MSDSIIVNGNKVEGKISAKTDLHIEGEVIGEISSEASVYIAESGIVQAEIDAVNVYISGKFKGSVNSSEFTQVYSGAYVKGKITTPSLEFEKGAKFVGEIDMGLETDMPITNIKPIVNEKLDDIAIPLVTAEESDEITESIDNEESNEIDTTETLSQENISPISDNLETKAFAQEETCVDIDISSVNMIDDENTIDKEEIVENNPLETINVNSNNIAAEKYQEKISAMELTEIEEV